DLGGSLYLFLERPEALAHALSALRGAPGLDVVVPRTEAERYHLPPERVGDLFCFGQREWALGVWAGAGGRPGCKIRNGRIVDLAPTLCRLLGFEAGDFEGRVLDEVLAP